MEEQKTFLGRWRSGRVWKTPETLKASKKIVTTGVKGHSWTEKLARRQQAVVEKALLQELREGREARDQIAKQKREARRKRKEANAARIQNTHQVVVNSKKLKRMSKKQFAQLKKQ